jgi:hypothetical protein
MLHRLVLPDIARRTASRGGRAGARSRSAPRTARILRKFLAGYWRSRAGFARAGPVGAGVFRPPCAGAAEHRPASIARSTGRDQPDGRLPPMRRGFARSRFAGVAILQATPRAARRKATAPSSRSALGANGCDHVTPPSCGLASAAVAAVLAGAKAALRGSAAPLGELAYPLAQQTRPRTKSRPDATQRSPLCPSRGSTSCTSGPSRSGTGRCVRSSSLNSSIVLTARRVRRRVGTRLLARECGQNSAPRACRRDRNGRTTYPCAKNSQSVCSSSTKSLCTVIGST